MIKFTNRYILVFSTIMVVAVALLLSMASQSLKPFQEKNIAVEKKQNILASLNVRVTRDEAEKLYPTYIRDSYVVDYRGDRVSGADAFTVDLKKEMAKPKNERLLPVYVAELKDSTHAVVLPLRGKGLWGPIWGYIALHEDMNTILGAMFDHQGETPGLGAEIAMPFFQEQFIGKKLFDDRQQFRSIQVIKGGAEPGNPFGVDAVSGGTITSKGLEAMVDTCLSAYKQYFITNRIQN